MTRAEKVAIAQQLRTEGLLLKQIAQRMGVAKTTVGTWLEDPDLSKQRARRKGYAGQCIDCGAPTDGSNGRDRTPERCQPCRSAYQHENRYWTPERIIAAIREFHRRYGRVPGAADFKSAPAHSWVHHEFGSWNAAIRAAGLTPRGVGQYDRSERWKVAA